MGCNRDNRTPADIKIRVAGVHGKMTGFRFLHGLSIGEDVLKMTDHFSKYLQKGLSTFAAMESMNVTVDALQAIRTDESLDKYAGKLENMRKAFGVADWKVSCKRTASIHFETKEQYISVTVREVVDLVSGLIKKTI